MNTNIIEIIATTEDSYRPNFVVRIPDILGHGEAYGEFYGLTVNNLNFAIEASTAQEAIDNFIDNGKYAHLLELDEEEQADCEEMNTLSYGGNFGIAYNYEDIQWLKPIDLPDYVKLAGNGEILNDNQVMQKWQFSFGQTLNYTHKYPTKNGQRTAMDTAHFYYYLPKYNGILHVTAKQGKAIKMKYYPIKLGYRNPQPYLAEAPSIKIKMKQATTAPIIAEDCIKYFLSQSGDTYDQFFLYEY